MPYCIVKKCKNYFAKVTKTDGISYFRFPRDPIRCEIWRKIIAEYNNDEYFKPTRAATICSDHFKESDIYLAQKCSRRRLSKTATPDLQVTDDIISKNPESATGPGVSVIEKIMVTPEFQFLQRLCAEESGTTTETGKSITTSLSTGSILDTPKEVISKKYLGSCQKQILIKNRKIINLQKVNKLLKKKYTSLKNALRLLRNFKGIEESIIQDLSLHVEVADSFNTHYLKNFKNKKIPFTKYTPGARKFAITLHFYSPAAYKYIRKMFDSCLPHPSTLYDWYRSVEAEPGFTAEALDRLKEKSKNTEREIICAMIVDEMLIRQQRIWNGKKYEGVVDLGIETTDSNETASQVYVILLVSVNDSWKIPLGYFLITSLTAEMKANIIKIALTKCHMCGVKIVSLTFDGCKSNIGTMKLLGCDISDYKTLKTHFKHPTAAYDIVIFLDACHMIKLMRNTLEAKKNIYNSENKAIKWQFFTDLCNLQEKNNLHLGNKLTHKNIAFRNEIIKVKLATQLFNNSVAKAMKFCDVNLKLSEFEGSTATTEFLEILNDVFDILNSRNFNNYGFKQPINSNNAEKILTRLDQAKEYLTSLSFNIRRKITLKKRDECRIIFQTENISLTKCQTGVIGLLVCIESIRYLYTTLLLTNKLSFLTTYKFSQDHVELFFGNIRSQGGFNNNPNCRQFKSEYRKLMYLELGSKLSANAILLENIPILNCTNIVANINNTSSGYRYDLEQEIVCNGSGSNEVEEEQLQGTCDQLSSAIEESDIARNYIDQIVGYIAGFVVRHLLKKIKCSDCNKILLATTNLWFHKLIDVKTMGGLSYAAEDVFKLCKKTEENIRRFSRTKSALEKKEITKTVLISFIQLNIFHEIHQHSLEQPAMFNHRISLLRAVIEKYIDVRLHYIGKKESFDKKYKSKRLLYNKLNLFQGI